MLTIESRRGRHTESVHRVSVAVTDPDGRLIAHAGDPRFSTFLRSAAKPFQAMPLVEEGVAARFGMSAEELALTCASHNSEPDQVSRVRALLERIGCQEDDLACGPHRPLWREMALSSETRDIGEVPRSRVASNCSGKHTGMLAFARHKGWPTAGYHEAGHQVQKRCLKEVARWADVPESSVHTAVDGCGVQCFAIPLDRVARSFARLATSSDAGPRAIVAAMTGHPELVAGRGRLCTHVMRAYAGRVVAKVGAEGVYAAAVADQGLGIGIKVEDGHSWGACVALVGVLEQLRVEPPARQLLAPFAEIPDRNTRGETVGALQLAGSLTFD